MDLNIFSNVFLVYAIRILDTVYNDQRLNLRVDQIEIGLNHGFVKHRRLNWP